MPEQLEELTPQSLDAARKAVKVIEQRIDDLCEPDAADDAEQLHNEEKAFMQQLNDAASRLRLPSWDAIRKERFKSLQNHPNKSRALIARHGHFYYTSVGNNW